MAKIQKPDYYKTPLKSRADITEWIIRETSQRYYRPMHYPFCFDVKCGAADLSFENLLKIHREENSDPIYTHSPEWLAAAREKYEETGESQLWEWAIEDAQNDFTGEKYRSDTYFMLWDGTPLDVEYSFQGRSGDWLSIDQFEGHKFGIRDSENARWELDSMSFTDLRKFYQLVTMLKHDLQHPEKNIEYRAADTFFENICNDIPKPDALQKEIAFADAPA